MTRMRSRSAPRLRRQPGLRSELALHGRRAPAMHTHFYRQQVHSYARGPSKVRRPLCFVRTEFRTRSTPCVRPPCIFVFSGSALLWHRRMLLFVGIRLSKELCACSFRRIHVGCCSTSVLFPFDTHCSFRPSAWCNKGLTLLIVGILPQSECDVLSLSLCTWAPSLSPESVLGKKTRGKLAVGRCRCSASHM
jgi:hypothetical protein